MSQSEPKFDTSDPKMSSPDVLSTLSSLPSSLSNVYNDCKYHEKVLSTSNGTYSFTTTSISPNTAPLYVTAKIEVSRPAKFRCELFHPKLDSTCFSSTTHGRRNSFVEVLTPSDGDNRSVLTVVLFKPTVSSSTGNSSDESSIADAPTLPLLFGWILKHDMSVRYTQACHTHIPTQLHTRLPR